MKLKIMIAFATAALAVASAATESYHVKLLEDATIGGQPIKKGEYTVELKDNKALLHHGKDVIETPVRAQDGDKKFAQTSVRYNTENGKMIVQEISLGGKKTKLVFADAQGNTNGL